MQLSPNYILVMQEETFLVLLLKVFPLSTDEPVIAVASETVLKRRDKAGTNRVSSLQAFAEIVAAIEPSVSHWG